MGKTIQYAGADLYPKQRAAIYDPARISIIAAGTKAGKAQPLDAVIYTPTGPRRMGEIEIGDDVLDVDGGAVTVMGVYPQGVKDIYRVTFSDGSSTECTSEHLWETNNARQGKRVVPLAELQAKTPGVLRRTWIPTANTVSFAEQTVSFDPYLLGLLIGDGTLGGESIYLSTEDNEILASTGAALDDRYYEVRHNDRCTYVLGIKVPYQHIPNHERLSTQLAGLGLLGKGSHEKHVPAEYRYNTSEVRWAILQGIFDTDGSVDRCGQPVLEQTSERLAHDVAEIIQSLGGFVRISTKRGSYRNDQGEVVSCRLVYRMRVTHPDAKNFFRLSRKRDKASAKKKQTARRFRRIEYVGRREAQCIEVNSARGLYLTDHFIATHNTIGCLAWFAEKALVEGRAERNYWWCAPVFGQSEIAYRRMKARLPKAYYKANQSKLTITLANGATMWFKSAERPDDLYGEDVYAVVMDEASRMREESWHAIRSTLTFTKGPVRMIGNVKGRKNWFYKLGKLAEEGADGMAFHKITCWDAVEAGVLDREEIEAAQRDFHRLGKDGAFAQLYLAEAADDGDNPFGLDAIEMCVLDGLETTREMGDSTWTHPDGGYPKAAGVDLAGRGAVNATEGGPDEARDRDYTSVVLLDREGQTVHISRFRKPHTETATEVHRIVGNTMALVDSTGAGDQQVEGFQRRGDMRVEGYTFTDRSRQDLLEGLAIKIGDQSVRFPNGWLRDELDSFEYRYERRGIRYAVPDGGHDDGVMALALASKKLPWRRRSSQAPVGVEKPGGSAWLGDGQGETGRELLGGQENAGDPTTVPAGVEVPILVVGSGLSRWGGAG